MFWRRWCSKLKIASPLNSALLMNFSADKIHAALQNMAWAIWNLLLHSSHIEIASCFYFCSLYIFYPANLADPGPIRLQLRPLNYRTKYSSAESTHPLKFLVSYQNSFLLALLKYWQAFFFDHIVLSKKRLKYENDRRIIIGVRGGK